MNESCSESKNSEVEAIEEKTDSSIAENPEDASNFYQEPAAEPEIESAVESEINEEEKVSEGSSISEEPVQEEPVQEESVQEESVQEEPPIQEPTQDQMKNLETKMDALLQLFQDRLLYDKHKDLINDRQYQELEGFRSGILEKLQKPIIMDIISEIDDCVKLEAFYLQKKEEYAVNKNPEELEKLFEKLLKLFGGIAPNLCDLLEKHDVTYWQTEAGEPFDPKIHTVLKKTATDNPELNKTICKSLRFGFKLNDKIIRREMVDVFVLQNPSPSETSSTSPLN